MKNAHKQPMLGFELEVGVRYSCIRAGVDLKCMVVRVRILLVRPASVLSIVSPKHASTASLRCAGRMMLSPT